MALSSATVGYVTGPNQLLKQVFQMWNQKWESQNGRENTPSQQAKDYGDLLSYHSASQMLQKQILQALHGQRVSYVWTTI